MCKRGRGSADMSAIRHDMFSGAVVELDDSIVRNRNVREIASRLKRNKSVQSLHLKDSLFTCEGYQSPTLKRLRCLLECIPHMKQLEEVTISGAMSIENPHDVQILANAIKRHPRLRRIRIHNFVVYAAELPDSAPLLDAFLESCSTVPHIETLHLKCHASYKTWQQSFISARAVEPLCRSRLLQNLTLSKLGLQDEHFSCIGRLLSPDTDSILSGLILNGNRNTDVGTQAIAKLLLPPSTTTLERLEILNGVHANQATSLLLLKLLNTNHSLKYCKINLKQQHRTKIDFYLLLNRSGRKTILNPDTTPLEAINVLSAVSSNVSVLMHLLRDNPAVCKFVVVGGSCGGIVGTPSALPLKEQQTGCPMIQEEFHRLLENDIGTISRAPTAKNVLRNLATGLWRRLRRK